MKKSNKIFAAILCLTMIASVGLAGCKKKTYGSTPSKEITLTLNAPSDLKVSADGLVTWSAVRHAESYDVIIDTADAVNVTTTNYRLTDILNAHTVQVRANGSGYESSEYASVRFTPKSTKPDNPQVTFGLTLTSETDGKTGNSVRVGKTVKFTANVTNATKEEDKRVGWTVVKGADNLVDEGSVSDKTDTFTVTVKDNLTGDPTIVVRATSETNSALYAEKQMSIVTKPVIDDAAFDAMLAKIGNESKISFDGFVNLDVYEDNGITTPVLAATNSLIVRTAMDSTTAGGRWMSEYENSETGNTQSLFCKNNEEGYVCSVSLDFRNTQHYTALRDESNNLIAWSDSGYYNNFKGLTHADFEFDETTWRYKYVGSQGKDLVSRLIASADPYDFNISSSTTFELILSKSGDGYEIVGVTSMAAKDYAIVSGYTTIQTLYCAISAGEEIEVPDLEPYQSIDDYENAETKAEYLKLRAAIENMRALESYTVEYTRTTQMMGLSTVKYDGYQELITKDAFYYRPYTNRADELYTDDKSYGYRKVGENRYNSFYLTAQTDPTDSDTIIGYKYEDTRAYKGSLDNVKPSFDFAAEIFTAYAKGETKDDVPYTSFYVPTEMSTVATTFSYGVGTEEPLYAMFATLGTDSSTGGQVPVQVAVQEVDGKYYITEVIYCYSIQSQGMYGVVIIDYSDFNKTTIDADKAAEIAQSKYREIPTSWNQINITEGSGADERQIPFDEYFTKYFSADGVGKYPLKDGKTVNDIPFIGDPDSGLGDRYALGMSVLYSAQYRQTDGTYKTVRRNTLKLYYDVPLDLDYTTDSSLKKVDALLTSKGFVADENGEYRNPDINVVIKPVDESLDFFVYIWTEDINRK